jgi:dihydrolipoamide dehydrogenase
MKEYDLIIIGTGSALNFVDLLIQENPRIKIAIIDKDEPGGICLTRGCIPSKILLYPAELIRTIERAWKFGIDVKVKDIDFKKTMERMRSIIYHEINEIKESLQKSKNIDYYPDIAKFIAPYTLEVGNEIISSKIIFLCTGSKPKIPPIKGLEETGYLTSDTILKISELPESIVIIGGGYVAAEYGHFLSAMGSKVTIVGRNPQFLPKEEPEISTLAKRELEKHMKIITNHEVREVKKIQDGKKKVIAINRQNGEKIELESEEILVAVGRDPNSDILDPEKSGIKTDGRGWILVNEFLETSQPNVWAIGDANGRYPFKHVANYEANVLYHNAILKERVKVDYHAVPHAVFTYPEIASVGLREKEAIEKYGKDNVMIGIYKYEDTAKGEAMGVKDYFVKVIIEKTSMKILGAHIIGPYASILIQEIITLMYTPKQTPDPIFYGMHIHPALSEVVERAFNSLMPPEQYHHLIEEHYKLVSE